MFKQTGRKKLGRKRTHRNALVKNQMRSLFTNGKLTTTSSKAAVLKANADSMLNKVRKGNDSLSSVRYLNSLLGDPKIVKAVREYAKSGATGVTIVKVGFRAGDMAETSRVEVPGYSGTRNVAKKKASTKKSVEKKDEAVKEVTKQNTELAAQESVKEDKLGSKLAKSFRTKIAGGKGKSTVRSGI